MHPDARCLSVIREVETQVGKLVSAMPGGLTSEISLQQLRALPVVRYLIYEFDWTEFLGASGTKALSLCIVATKSHAVRRLSG